MPSPTGCDRVVLESISVADVKPGVSDADLDRMWRRIDLLEKWW